MKSELLKQLKKNMFIQKKQCIAQKYHNMNYLKQQHLVECIVSYFTIQMCT